MMTNANKNTKRFKKIEQLLVSEQSVFTVQDLAVIWQIDEKQALYNHIKYYIQTGKIKNLHKGIYTVKEYTSFDVAQKLIIPSYISCHTALAVHGISFQLYTTIHSVALKSKQLLINDELYVYHQLKAKVFYNPLGIEDKTTYLIAGPERSICDSLYFAPKLAFDNLDIVDFNLLKEISLIYDNKRLELEIEKIINIEKKYAR